MKERPILFSGDMVRAILEGRKTQTRRIIKLADGSIPTDEDICWWEDENEKPIALPIILDSSKHFPYHKKMFCPYGQPGDRLWVRETWAEFSGIEPQVEIVYRADKLFDTEAKEHLCGNKWRPSIHMPRWASRITLEITGVRVERLQDISEEDARSEGIIDGGCLNCGEHELCGCDDPQPDARESFIYLWKSIYGEDSWNANPWVWVIELRRVK